MDAYIDAAPRNGSRTSAAGSGICCTRRIRTIDETIKRPVQPYFVLQGNVAALLAAKNHVNVFLYDGALAPDPEGIITGGHDNKTARMIAIDQHRPVQRARLARR